jgi:hypothetical protein
MCKVSLAIQGIPMTEEAVLKIDHTPFLDVTLEVRLITPQWIIEGSYFRGRRRMDHP